MAEQRVKLTKESVDRATSRPAPYWDSVLPGFGLRVGRTGSKAFFVRYRPKGTGRGGPKRFYTIGKYGPLTPDQARNEAKRILGQVAAGEDPAAAIVEAREAVTVAGLAALYLDEVRVKRKPTTATLYQDYLHRHVLPDIGRAKAASVGRATIAKLHMKVGKRHPVAANRTLAVVSAMFGFAEKRGLLPTGHVNPAQAIDKFPETGRERFLTTEELERLGASIREAETVGIAWDVDETKPTAKHTPKRDRRTVISPFAGAAIRLLLFTGCRLREVLDLRWREVDFERGMLHLPDSKTGKKSVILNAPALAVLAALPRLGEYVIAGDDPTRPRSDLKRPWDLVTRRVGLAGLRLHDLRHCFASTGVGASLGLPIVGKLLGHKSTETTQRYAHLAPTVIDEIECPADNAVERVARARANLSELEDTVRDQVERYIREAKLSDPGHHQRRTVRVFSDVLRDVIAQIDTSPDERVRSLLMTGLGFLLRVSNNAGALAGDLAAEEKRKRTAPARRARSALSTSRLSALYNDVAQILKEKDQNKTGEVIFRKLREKDPEKYPESKRRMVVRDIDNEILPREQLARGLGLRRQEAIDNMWAEVMRKVKAELDM
jgi:integrase